MEKFKSRFELFMSYLIYLFIFEVVMFALIYYLREFIKVDPSITKYLVYGLFVLLNINIPLIIVNIRKSYTRRSIINDKSQIIGVSFDKIESWLAKKIFYLFMLLISIL